MKGRRSSGSLTIDVKCHETYWFHARILCYTLVFDSTVSPLYGCEKLYLVI